MARISVLATSLYGAALGVSAATRYAISMAAPLVWRESLGTFVVPGVMVLVMSQLIPAARQSVPAAVDRWFDEPERADRPGQK